MAAISSDCNYVEHVITDGASVLDASTNVTIYDCNVSDDKCNKVFEVMHHRHLKHYERSIKQYVHGDMFYEIAFSKDPEPEIRAYRKTIEAVSLEHPSILKVCFQKQKIPIHAFPSSNNMYEVNYIKRLTFRKNNRIFLNVDYVKSAQGQESRKIFVNMNLDANTDVNYIMMELEPLLKDLKAALEGAPAATC